MRLLALDTATDACSAALWLDGELHERFAVCPREHTRRLLPMIEELMAAAGLRLGGLDGLAFGQGPGSFTGLRIAAGVAQGLALGADLPVLPVSDLAALARAGWRETGASNWIVCLDARMGEVYTGRYRVTGDTVEAEADEAVLPPAAVPVPARGRWRGIGPGFAAYAEALQARLGKRLDAVQSEAWPRAGDIAALAAPLLAAGGGLPPEQAQPVYLRDNVASKPA